MISPSFDLDSRICCQNAFLRECRDKAAFSGRVALVTGAGAGLGWSYALRLARHGATVIVNNRAHPDRPSSAQAVVDEITAAGGTAIADQHSVQYDDQTKAMIDLAYDRNGAGQVRLCILRLATARNLFASYVKNVYTTLICIEMECST